MKVMVVNNMAPFLWGGAEELAVYLQKNLIIAGHEAEILRIPFHWEPATQIPTQMLLARTLELENVDRVIALKFPAYYIRHPAKTLWLLHQYRQAYDLFETGHTNLPPGEAGDALRTVIRNADDETFRECRGIYTNSEVTRQRLLKYNGFDSKVLLPPVNDPVRFSDGKAGEYIFAGGRVNGMKRQYLLLEAMAYTNRAVKLIIGGPPEGPEDETRLKETVERLGLQDRVTLDIRFLPRDVYAEYVRNAGAVAYLPFDEDSLGYVAMEGALAGKPLITTSDSGGILGLVKPGETGWVAEPTAESLADAMNEAMKSKRTRKLYGDGAQALWEGLGINWPQTIETLVQ